MRNLITGLKSLLNKPRTNRELEEELDTYLQASTTHKQSQGLPPDQARLESLRELGSRNSIKHQVWTTRWEFHLDNTLQDLRLGVRGLLKSPGFTLVALLSLALGIGANTSIFTLLNAILLRPLPVPHPEQLVLFGTGQQIGSNDALPNGPWELFSYPGFKEFRAKQTSFADIAANHSIHAGAHATITGSAPEPVRIDLVSGNYFNVMQVQPILGRAIAEQDDQAAGAGNVLVATYAFFQNHLNGNPKALGQSIDVNGHPYTLIGVAPPNFIGAVTDQPADLFTPLSMEAQLFPGWNGLDNKSFQSLFLIARIKPNTAATETISTQTPAINLLFKQILRNYFTGTTPSQQQLNDIQLASIALTPMANGISHLRYAYSLPLKVLMAIVALVLLIACANIANMLLARGVTRTREVAVRMALGASRSRIVLQLLTESTLLALLGAAAGTAIAWQAAPLLLKMSIPGPPTGHIPIQLKPDLLVLAFTLFVTVATALLFGILPAFKATRLESIGGLTPALKEGRGGGQASTRSPFARGLIVGQIALSVLLLAAAGLFLRSLLKLTSIDTGFNAKNVLVFSLDESSKAVPDEITDPIRLTQLHQQIDARISAIPGVTAESFSAFTFDQGMNGNHIILQSAPPSEAAKRHVLFNNVGPGFFQTLGIGLRAGRSFSLQDTATSPKVAIVNETMQRTFFPNQSAIGQRFGMGSDPAHAGDIEIIGVVKDAKYVGLDERPRMATYTPYTQNPQNFSDLSIRYQGGKAPIIAAVRQALAEVNPNILIPNVFSLEDQVQGSIATQRLIAKLSAFFGLLAVFLSCIGIYGLMSYSVLRRTNEIGIRLALGAQANTLLWMILKESILLLSLGLAAGIPVALATTGILTKLLYQLTSTDPLTYLIAAAVVAIMTVLAAWLPARKATKINPTVALRCD